MRIQENTKILCMTFSDYLTSLICLPNINDFVMTKLGPRFEIFDLLAVGLSLFGKKYGQGY